jgi:hypothetical protein
VERTEAYTLAMTFEGVAGLIVIALIVAIALRRVVTRRGRARLGPAAAGAVYDMLNKDKREAVEVIVEERAEARDPEDAEGNLPDLDEPSARDRGTR